MRLLNVLTVGLLMALPSLRAQFYGSDIQYYDATVDTWIQASPADGSWEAGGDTLFPGTYNCELCSTDAYVSVEIDEDGFYLTSDSYDDPNGNASLTYVSRDPNTGDPIIVDLNASYEVYGNHSWGDGGGAQTYCSITIPGIPTVYLNSIDASYPGAAYFNYRTVPDGVQSLYSSTVTIGGQNAFSSSTENPQFYFDESQYPTLCCTTPYTTPITFQGYLAGHFFEGPTYYLSVTSNQIVTDYFTSSLPEGTEITGGIPTTLSVTHVATESFDIITYPPGMLLTSVPEYVIDLHFGKATYDSHANICTPNGVAECDIALAAEVNRWPFPPYPAVNNDPMPRVDPTTVYYPPKTDSTNFVVMEVDYYGLWLQEGTGFAVCNTLFEVYSYTGGAPPLNPMGCIGLTLP